LSEEEAEPLERKLFSLLTDSEDLATLESIEADLKTITEQRAALASLMAAPAKRADKTAEIAAVLEDGKQLLGLLRSLKIMVEDRDRLEAALDTLSEDSLEAVKQLIAASRARFDRLSDAADY
jgi:hypothetical protein